MRARTTAASSLHRAGIWPMSSSNAPADRQSRRRGLLVDLARSLSQHRQETQDFVKTHRQKLAEIQAKFASETDIIASRLTDWEEYHQVFQQRYAHFRTERDEMEKQRLSLDRKTQELETFRTETEAQRRRVAQKLDDRRRKMFAEKNSSTGQLQDEIADLRKSLDTAQAELESMRRKESSRQSAESARDEEFRGLTERLSALQSELDAQRGQLATSGKRVRELEEELSKARQVAESPSAAEGGDDHWREQYEMAMESVEALRAKNDRLEGELCDLRDQVAKARTRPATSGETGKGATGKLDWEAQKKRLLANLEQEDLDEDDASRVEEAIRATDAAVAEKDEEIADLRLRLADLESAAPPPPRPDDSKLNELLDRDAIIAQERERLTQLQREWENQLRTAEVDCAKERAELARMKSELAQKLRDVESELGKIEPTGTDKGARSKNGRRWMDHLGLSNRNDGTKG